MKTVVIWVVVILVLLGGWHWYATKTASAPAPTPSGALGTNGSPDQTNTGQPSSAPLLSVAHDATLGDYLVAENGMTVYMYANDETGVSNCSGTCAANWPPYAPKVANEPLVTSAGITGQLTAITRADTGSMQLTYNGKPLYFWKNDTKPGDTTGQGVGGVWFVVAP
jgi:predicted lipoprotein with Yx(FWY)xxD motif